MFPLNSLLGQVFEIKILKKKYESKNNFKLGFLYRRDNVRGVSQPDRIPHQTKHNETTLYQRRFIETALYQR